jgi:Soluble lytic murein transglycosylase and related regulatory proteins (some contain LysM/invasin domains)
MKRFLMSLGLCLFACNSSRQTVAAGEATLMSFGSDPAASAIARSDKVKQAQTAIDEGHPWRATQLMAPVMRDAHQRTPAAILVAARAAAGWGGWAEVEKLLAKETWVDTAFEGEGEELLARAALERDDDTAALTRATAALRDTKSPPMRALREAIRARALERNNMFDSAAASYLRAAEILRPVRDWLYLRAAGSEVDSSERGRIFAKVMLAPAKPRVAWTDAQARERFSDALGAASRYAALGATVQSLRLRLSVAPDSATRTVVKNELLAFIRTHGNTADARSAVDVLDRGFTDFTPGEELEIARATAAVAPSRAVTAFKRALTSPSLFTARDRLEYAQALVRAGRSREALAQFQQVRGPLAGQAMYQRARVFLTAGTRDQTRSALRDVARRFATDADAASAALYLLADLATDDGDDAGARAMYQQIYRTYPASSRAGDSRFNAAIIDLASGRASAAAHAFDSLRTLMPRSDEALAATYWSGRAWDAAGSDATARERWQEVVDRQPMSYYGFAAAKRLGSRGWSPVGNAAPPPHVPAVDSAIARIALLERLGMDVEARFEYDALDDAASESPRRLAATAQALTHRGQSARAIRLAQKLVDGGHADVQTYRLLFPLFDRDELAHDAKANELDPVLVAGLIRQESAFYPRALSVAGARGLMQVLPSVGEEVSRALTYPVWYPSLLFDPDANLQLGTAHLASVVKQHGSIPRVLAAYNAGGSRVTRWVTKAGMDDPELFAERIPFAETRDYVRIVQRNVEVYRELYEWK